MKVSTTQTPTVCYTRRICDTKTPPMDHEHNRSRINSQEILEYWPTSYTNSLPT